MQWMQALKASCQDTTSPRYFHDKHLQNIFNPTNNKKLSSECKRSFIPCTSLDEDKRSLCSELKLPHIIHGYDRCLTSTADSTVTYIFTQAKKVAQREVKVMLVKTFLKFNPK